jgi:hypothetical protein
MSAATKRTFLNRAFHPDGCHACAVSGMVNASDEVLHAEFVSTQRSLDTVSDDVVQRAIERASWMVDVLVRGECPIDMESAIGEGEGVCADCGSPCAVLTLHELLVKFYLAMRLEEEDARGQLVR